MILNKHNVKMFEKTDILSVISSNGYYVVINGPQLIHEFRNSGKRTFSGYTNASKAALTDMFRDSKRWGVIYDNNVVTVYEADKSRKNMYVFSFTCMAHVSSNALLFCESVFSNFHFEGDKVGYVPGEGVIDINGSWEKLKSGEFAAGSEFESEIAENPSLIAELLASVISEPLVTLDEYAVRAIRANASLIAYSSQDAVRELMTAIMKKNPAKIKIIEQLGLFEYLLPDFHRSFSVKNNVPDFVYDSIGDGCIAAMDKLSEIAAWVVFFYCIGETVVPQVSFGEYSMAIDFIEEAMRAASDFLGKCGYPETFIYEVLVILYIIDNDIPELYDDRLEFVLKNFDTKERFDDYAQAKCQLLYMYSGKYREKEENSIRSLIKTADVSSYAWERNKINISDEDIISIVGEERAPEALLYIKKFIFEEPSANDSEVLIKLLKSSSKFGGDSSILDESNEVISSPVAKHRTRLKPDVRAMLEERSRILKKIDTFDFDMVNKIAFSRTKQSDENIAYAKEYFDYSEKLSKINDELLNTDAFTDDERDLVQRCQDMNRLLGEELKRQRFIDSIFVDTDTSFFENVYMMAKAARENSQN